MSSMKLVRAPDLDELIADIIDRLELEHIPFRQVVAFRSFGAKANARARIYAMPRIWQIALNIKPVYCVEFLSEHFDHLSSDDRTRVVIHELLHIPKTFSGALVPHRGSGHRHQVTHHTVEKLFTAYKSLC